jgi:hypothetical protein
MRHSFSIYFYLKRRKLQKDSKSTIMLRIIVDNKAADVSLKTSILQEHWDKQNRRVSAMNPEAHDINAYLDNVSSTLLLPTGPTGRKAAYSKHAETTLHGNRIQSAFSPEGI